jgi:alpha-soluble NSF attachment protein
LRTDVEAGKAFEQASQIQIKHLNEPDDAANTLVDAFKVLRKDDPQSAAKDLTFAIDRYCSRGNFRRAAGHKEALGEMLEENGDSKGALDCFEAAAGWYEGDGANA